MGIDAQQVLQNDPEFLRRQMAQQEMQRLNPTGGAAGAIGTVLGRGLGNVSSGRGFFDTSDPALQRVSKLQKLQSEAMEEGEGDPVKTLQALSNKLTKESDLAPLALQVQEQLLKLKPTKDKPIVVGRDAALVTSTGEVIYEGPGKETESYRTLSPADNRERGLPANLTFQENKVTGKLSQVGSSPAVVFNKPLVGSQTEYAKTVGKAAAERDVKQFETAETAINNLEKINTTLAELQTSDAITGLGAEIFNNVERFKLLVTANKKAGKKVSDTEYLDALLGSEVFPMIGALGIGARGLDTPAEREFLRKVMTGTIEMNRDTLIKLTQTRKRIEERAIENYNNRVKKGEYKEFFEMQSRPPVLFEIPKGPSAPTTAPTGQWRIVK